MTIYAVMKTGGKEYRVAQGDVVRVEKLAAAPGATVEIREVLSIETEQGVTVGSPTVVDARVIADVTEEGHGEKILIFKKKRRDHYQMMTGELQSYSALRIREIVVGQGVYAVAAPRSEVAAAAMPPALPPRIPKPKRKIAEPQAKEPLQPPMPSAPSSRAPVERVPPVAVPRDAPVYLKLASEELVGTQPQAAKPSRDAAHPVQPVESPPSAPYSTETPTARKRNHGIAALIAGLLVIAAGLLVWGSPEPRVPSEAAVGATVAASPQAEQPAVPPPAAKAPPRKELAVKKTAAASAPSAPVQPPE